MSSDVAISVVDLVKNFGSNRALDGLSFEAPVGRVLGLLGPNGAGKTTCVRVLTTLLRPDGGSARVLGHDVVQEANRVRHHIGVAGQYASVDGLLSGRQNLVMIGRLSQLTRADARRRAGDLLDEFGLTDAADRQVSTYSGGMRRRIDLAASLITQPPLVILDEPTTGLDPRGRQQMWEVIERLVKAGTTLLLTTQYLEEADRLADQIVVVDRGRAVADGTPEELKQKVGSSRLEVTLEADASLTAAAELLRPLGSEDARIDERRHSVSIAIAGTGVLPAAVRALDGGGVAIADIAVVRPSLDDVFMTLTGHAAETATATDDEEVSA